MLFGNSDAKRRGRGKLRTTTVAPIEPAPIDTGSWERSEHAFTGEIGGLGK